jgi:23S rRNA pseudouridine1911/1915/1917 synthase
LLNAHAWDKRYLAVVGAGSLPDNGECNAPLAPDPKNHRRVIVDARHGQRCSTTFTVARRGARFDLVEARASNAYRHQVRAHLSLLHAPLIGDALYGGPDCAMSPRHCLHASYIAIPALGWTPVTCPLPDDLRALLDAD